jgi:hypothetical protein
MFDTFTVSFFGHRYIDNYFAVEKKLEELVRELLMTKTYVEFLIGRDGEFDQIVASTVKTVKRSVGDSNSALVWVMAYPKAEYSNNEESFDDYYDEIEICEASSHCHFKSAIQVRNRNMVDRSDLVACFVERDSGGAYSTLQYARKQEKQVINLAESENE